MAIAKIGYNGAMEAPFRVGGVVEPPYFVGREEELRLLEASMRGLSQNALILAPRRYGKSSLLWNLRRRVEEDRTLLAPYVNCRDMTGPEDLFRGFVQALLCELERKQRLRGLWEKFRLVFGEKVLEAVRALEEIGGEVGEWGQIYLRFRERELDREALVRAAFAYPKRIAAARNLRIVFLVDEFQEVARFDGYIFSVLKKELDEPGNVRFFFSGSSLGLVREVFLREESPLYLMVARFTLSALDRETSLRFLAERFNLAGLEVEEGVPSRIHELTGGVPFYLQKLGLLVVQRALLLGEKRVGKTSVEKAFREMLAEMDGEFEVRWLARFSPLQRRILRTLARLGKAGVSEIARGLGTEPVDISSSLSRLRDAMVVERTEDGYSLTDPVFARWLAS